MVCLQCALQVVLLASVTAKISYFWHITDIHLDVDYSVKGDPRKNCWRPESGGGSGSGNGGGEPVGRYGNYNCDSPWALVQSAARAMKTKIPLEEIEFVLWTGDGLSVMSSSRSSEKQVAALQNLTLLFSHTFPSQFVFPVLGHDDPGGNPGERLGYRELAQFWRHWLPSEALNTFVKGGYYTIEHKDHKLRIIALNTNLYSSPNKDEDSSEQFIWLSDVLEKSQRLKEKVYIVGHMGPGPDERQPDTVPQFEETAARQYLALVRKYSDIIVGQFFGHLHSDTFRLVYSGISARPVSWMLIAPSVSPRRTNGGANNPGLRLYKYNKETAQVLDYTQFYLDLNQANQRTDLKADWSQEYNFTSYYNLVNITPTSLHELASSFRYESPSFDRYYRANSVSLRTSHCDDSCVHTHYCATTRVEYSEFRHCLDAAASALASGSTAITAGLFVLMSLGAASLAT